NWTKNRQIHSAVGPGGGAEIADKDGVGSHAGGPASLTALEGHSLIGREAELNQLREVLSQGVRGRGKIVFVEGTFGIGKSTLLRGLEEQARTVPELEKSVFAYGYCVEMTGAQNAYQPFVEILDGLSKLDKK